MDFLIDLIPALPFILVAFGVDIYLATKLAMALALVQLIVGRLYYGRFKRMHIVTFLAIIVFGTLTLTLHDDRFIKLKPTVLNWAFALVFLVAPLLLKKNLLKLMLAEKIAMPEMAWNRLNLMWVAYFFIIGAANLYIALEFSREVWGSFRVFGIYGALLVFMVIQGVYVYRHMQHEEEAPVVGGGDQ
ncbi:MAG TPA: inner membrane-spanning protein YciB [Burkholderiales bacterium]